MTDDEASALRPGDVIETWYGGRRHVPALVVNVGLTRIYDWLGRSEDVFLVHIRRPGTTKKGQRYPVTARSPCDVHLVKRYDPTTANVFSDWLDERGEHRAAALLREAFPLAPACG